MARARREPTGPPVELPSTELAVIKELYLEGRYRQAYEVGRRFGSLAAWSGPAARLIAGRLAIQLGAPRLGRQLHLLAFRESPTYLEAIYYHARYRMERYGPLSCWEFQSLYPDWSEASPELRADWLALRGFTAARYRDFERSEAFFAQSEATAPDRPWHYVERSSALELAEQLPEALASARRSLEIQPLFRPGVQSVAHLLLRLGKTAEARELLLEAAGKLESALVVSQLLNLQLELGEYTAAEQSIERFLSLSPLLEGELKEWLAARQTDTAYFLGQRDALIHFARQTDEEFYTALAQEVESRAEFAPARMMLELDYGTPTQDLPSTGKILAQYWRADWVETVPEQAPRIEGTADAHERAMFHKAEWSIREGTFHLDLALELISRKVPFIVTIVEAGFPQSRLVIGADPIRKSVYFADYYERKPVEVAAKTLTTRYAPFGPRCLVPLPPGQDPALLGGLTFPDEALYDRVYRIVQELEQFHLRDAEELLQKLVDEAPDHRLTWLARLTWARATQHPYKQLAVLNTLLERYPHETAFTLAKAGLLRELGRITERREFLETEGRRKDADPLLMQSLAQLLLTYPEHQADADRLLRESLKVRPHAASGIFLLAASRWEQQEFPQALELYRLACCLDEREEQFSEAYVRAALAVGQLSETVKFFQRRLAREKLPTSATVRALVEALTERGEPEFAATALDKSLEKLQAAITGNPEQRRVLGELLLFRADRAAARGNFALAEQDLAAAEPLADPEQYLKTESRIARTRPVLQAARQSLERYLALNPFNGEVYRLMIGVMLESNGKAAVREFLQDRATRYPAFYPILKYRSEFLTPEEDEAGIAATQALIDLEPTDAWAHRQLALALSEHRRHEEALTAITRAGELEPHHPAYYAVLANLHRRADRSDEAIETFRQGLSRYVDHELAIVEYVRTARGLKEKKTALRFIAEQLHEQPHTGEGLLAYRDQVLPLIDDPEEQERFFAELERFLDERPDLWQAWSIVVQQLIMMHRAEEASSLGKNATERFPLAARLWLDLAEAYKIMEQTEERIDALRRAVAVAPGWTQPVRELADALIEDEEFEQALKVLEGHVARSPLDALGYGFLAERYWESEEPEKALETAMRAVRHEPGYDWAWSAVANWGERLDQPDAVVRLARELAQDRLGDARVWMKLARALHRFDQSEEAIAALDHAIRLEPKNPDPHDLKAERLAEIGRFDEALAATRPPELIDELPLTLQGRAAWIEARRGNFAAAIPPMQALVSVDPDYYWGWQQLAEWYNDTGRSEAYLEAASELCRLRPEHPTALTMRGEARLQTDDREGGKQDLREALRIHPAYSPAAAILFDACLADNELKEARSALAVLQEHLDGPEGLVKQISYAVKTDDPDAATNAFRMICEYPGEGPPTILQMGLFELRQAGWEARAYEQMGEVWRGDEPFNPWAGLLWLDSPPAEMSVVEDRLAACQAVLKFYPRFAPAYDRYAEQLTRVGRFDDALAACTPEAIQPIPITLRGRAAWVVAQRGDRDAAMTMMRELLAEDPDYAWGWRQITHWADDLGRPQDCLDAANQLVRLAPEDPYSYGIRGEAKRLLGDHRGARDDYQKAYELDPSFVAAGQQLLNEQLATDDLSGATQTLNRLQESASGPLLKLRTVQLFARQKQLLEARKALRDLCCDEDISRQLIREAVEALDLADWKDEATQELAEVLELPDVNPLTATIWTERLIEAGQQRVVADQLKELVGRSPAIGREAALSYSWIMALMGQPEIATATVQRFADLLRETVDGWARAGATLAEARKYPLAIAWLSDHAEREELEPWMLRALAIAYRGVADDAQAAHVTRIAFEMNPDSAPPDLAAWRILDLALAGETAEANKLLDLFDRVGISDGTRLILSLADGLILVQEASAAERGVAFAEAKQEWRTAAGSCALPEVPVGLSRAYKRCVGHVVKRVGSWKARLWGLWQTVHPLIKEA